MKDKISQWLEKGEIKIDDMRKRRNQFTYDVEYIDSISDAHEFIKAVIHFIKNQWPLENEYKKI